MTTPDPDPARLQWQAFRRRWLHVITAPDGILAYDPLARTRIAEYGVEVYDFDPSWIVPARFEPATEPTDVQLAIAHHAGTKRVPGYGTVLLSLGGTQYELLVYSAPGEEYHVSFRDRTSGVTTYPGGRVVFVPHPPGYRGGAFDFTLDLNRTVNGPCGYSTRTACALPPRSNTLDVPVTAGEKTTAWIESTSA